MTFSLLPRTVYKTKSKISGEIVVKELLGQYTLSVQGMIQSGGITKGVWKKALKRVTSHLPRRQAGESRVTNVLILGLGGGTVVQLIKARWPEAKIVGIEIDPEIVKISKKYFGLNEIKNLKIITANAIKWVDRHFDHLNHRSKFDLILVDLYLGDQFPPKAASEEFLKGIKKLLSKKGVAIFNRLKNGDRKELKENLASIFSQVESLDLKTNLFLICRP